MPSISNDGGKGPRIPGANTPESLSAYQQGYAGINWNAREEEVPAVRGATEDAAAEEE